MSTNQLIKNKNPKGGSALTSALMDANKEAIKQDRKDAPKVKKA